LRGDPVTDERAKRKLAAIFSADVKGYSRLMGDDEEDTVRTINTYRKVMINLIAGQGGRVVDAKGDNILAEFPSIVDALRSAVDIQKELAKRNAELPEHRKMAFRIGVNLGDVIEEEGTIYGDGVNIAARLEGLSEGGGICISGTAFDHVGKRLSVGYDYLGEKTVKNIEKPIRVYRVLMEPEHAGKVIGEEGKRPSGWAWKALAAAVALALVAGGIVWNLYWRAPGIEPASIKKMAHPLPDRPSIAVLPFVNMSGDPNQEFLCDGITEEITTALAKIPQLFVISRQSAFAYKGRPVKVNQVSEDMGVQYVLEGSLQRSGNRVRIAAQLIDALKGHHLWAERYERHLEDIFAIQDEITLKIITALQVKLTAGELANVWAKGTKSLEAYLTYMQAYAEYVRQTKQGNATARRLASEIIVMDPHYPRGYILLAQTHLWDILLGTTPSAEQSLAKATELVEKALDLDDMEPSAHGILGSILLMSREYDSAIAQVERSISLNPNSYDNLLRLGFVLLNAGRPQEAISALKSASRLNPIPLQHYYLHLATAYRLTGQLNDAVETAKEALKHVPNNISMLLQLAASLSMMDRNEEARSAALEVLRIKPDFLLEWYGMTIYFKNQKDIDQTIVALRKAGLN
jgi:adenylate cyclase